MDIRELSKGMICSECRKAVKVEGMFLTCGKCGLAYPVVEGLPNMLTEDAWKLEKARKSGFRHGLTFD